MRTIRADEVSSSTVNFDEENVTEVHFVRFDDYHGGAPTIDRIVAKSFGSFEEVTPNPPTTLRCTHMLNRHLPAPPGRMRWLACAHM